uniref:Uncharacterized protein n=1 Tax=Mustela putorius furo TaxID=9669 RepID=M3YYV3_MUSPF
PRPPRPRSRALEEAQSADSKRRAGGPLLGRATRAYRPAGAGTVSRLRATDPAQKGVLSFCGPTRPSTARTVSSRPRWPSEARVVSRRRATGAAWSFPRPLPRVASAAGSGDSSGTARPGPPPPARALLPVAEVLPAAGGRGWSQR